MAAEISATDTPSKKTIHAIGLMSGTSADGVDGVLISMDADDATTLKIIRDVSIPFSDALRARIQNLIISPEIKLDLLGETHSELGECYSQAVKQLQKGFADDICVVGCHGQTVRHQPHGKSAFTLQIGDAAKLAVLSGLAVVTDFRSSDLARGGQGAPLAPAFHRAVFSNAKKNRAIINLGGIANITHLPAGGGDVIGFDTGPANTLLDLWCKEHFATEFDRGGAAAARGVVNPKLLSNLLSDEYFAKPYPKSTGREYFNRAWLDAKLSGREFANLSASDVLATLTELTARCLSGAINNFKIDEIYACGGGVLNLTLMESIAKNINCKIASTAELGIPPQLVESAAFAWLAVQTLNHKAATLPSVTGARAASIAGAIYYP